MITLSAHKGMATDKVKQAASIARLRAKRKAAGKCPCGNDRDSDYILCSQCRLFNRTASQIRKERQIAGEVCRCGAAIERPDRRSCLKCRRLSNRSAKLKYKERLAVFLQVPESERICVRCGKNKALPQHRDCEECWWKVKANTYFHDRSKVSDLKQLWSYQKGLCALTGRQIAPPKMELDHIIPVSRGGPTEMGNLQWVTYGVNILKSNLLYDDLLQLCRDILKHANGVHPEEWTPQN